MKQYNITGMSCAACAVRIEKAVSAVNGVDSCSVSLLTNLLGVEGTADDAAIIRAVRDAGYGITLRDGSPDGADADPEDVFTDRETPVLRKRLFAGLAFLLPLIYGSMGHTAWGWPLPGALAEEPVLRGVIQLLLCAVILLINRRFFLSGTKSVLHGAPNMDTLIALGSGASFLWSVYALALSAAERIRYGSAEARDLYFESAAMILVLVTVGKLLEAKSKGRTTNALRSLIRLAPKTATVLRDGTETVIPAKQVGIDDIFIVKPGESIPADGIVTEGITAVDESALTGESIPADKTVGDGVNAATVNLSGHIRCRAVRVGEDTAFSQIIRMVSDAAATKAPIARLADKVSGIFVPAVTAIALVTLTVWLLTGKPFDFALARAVSVLVISCPCALGLATPVAVMVAGGVGAKHGILFKTAASLEECGRVRIAALDKTGTLTKGAPEITDILPADGATEEELLRYACSLEIKSEHPLAGAIVREAEKRGLTAEEVTDFRAVPGCGVTARYHGRNACGGSLEYIRSSVGLDEKSAELAFSLARQGRTPLLFADGERLLGIIAAADTIKEDSAQAIEELKALGVAVVMLTGDNEQTAAAIAERAGIAHTAAQLRPGDKAELIRRLRELGKVAMIGDGINDAPALTAADVGFAIASGTDIAAQSAQIVLMNSSLRDAAAAIRLSRAALNNIRENLFWAFFYNAVCIPVAAGCFIGLFGWQLDPMAGAAAMSLSSFCVVSNALRLNLFKFNPSSRPRKRSAVRTVSDEAIRTVLQENENQRKEQRNMKKTLKIEGMMCPHCEAHVRQALEALDGVEAAVASFKDGTAVLTLSADVSETVLRETVEKAGYTCPGIE